MTRKEQIRNKARELGQTYFPDSANIWARSNVEAAHVENACVEMAEWADQHPNWISVEDEPYPPKKNKWDKKSEEVLIYGLWMGRPTRLFGTYQYDTNEWGANGLISNITHWMPLPQPPRKEE